MKVVSLNNLSSIYLGAFGKIITETFYKLLTPSRLTPSYELTYEWKNVVDKWTTEVFSLHYIKMLSLSLDGSTQGYDCKENELQQQQLNDASLQRASAENDPVRIDCNVRDMRQ